VTEPIHAGVTVGVTAERAFETFVDDLASWWPPEYTWSQDVLDNIGIEPHEGGLCFERHGDGGEGYAQMLGAPQGRPLLLDRFAAAYAAAGGG
jgi:hypothetical protein